MMDTRISLKMINRLFAFMNEDIVKNYDIIFINLNSVFNTMFYAELVVSVKNNKEILKEYVSDIQTIIKEKVMMLYSSDRQMYFYFSSKPSVNSLLYPNWDSEVNKSKFDDVIHPIFMSFMNSIASFTKDFKNMKCIDTKNIEASVVPFLYAKKHTVENALIISREALDMLSVPKGFHLTDGNIFMKTTGFHASTKFTCVPPTMFPKYLFLQTIKKYSYVGPIKGIGKMKGAKYVMDMYTEDTPSGKEEVFKSKAFKIFDMDEYIRYFKINISF